MVAVVAGAMAIDEGEVVVLTTYDAAGREHVTQLWIVELEGRPYLRATSPDNAWLERLAAQPRAILTRDDEDFPVTSATRADPEVRERVNQAMAEKYGASDRLYSTLFDRSQSVPVRLDPRAADPSTITRRGAHGGP